MPGTLFKRFAAPIICASVAITGGVAGGASATQGLQLNNYGNGVAKTVPAAEMNPAATGSDERSLGYRWATVRSIRRALDCPGDSWNFERGCLDYLRDSAS